MNAIAVLPEAQEAAPMVDVVVPVHDEEADLERSIRRLHDHLVGRFPFTARVTIVDNASTDRTWAVAQVLERDLRGVRAIHLPEKGRGGALATAWLDSDALVVAYMDVDLSTDLDALLPLVAPLVSGHSDLAIGSRLAHGARVARGLKRELISRCYNLLLHLVLRVRFSDAQCGFKAMRADVARRLLPLVEDRGWFFDTELLVLAEKSGLRIHEVPVDWTDDPDSRVDIVRTAAGDLRGMLRVSHRLAAGEPLDGLTGRLRRAVPGGTLRQLRSFAAIGAGSTLAYALLFWVLRPVASAPVANAAALLLTAIANTAANRRFTFRVRGRSGLAGDQVGGLVALGLGLAITNASIGVLAVLSRNASPAAELGALAGANAAATLVRFALLRALILRRGRGAAAPAPVVHIARRYS